MASSVHDQGSSAVVPAPRYVMSVALGAVLALGVLSAALAILDARGDLPPPPIANSLCIDEKLAFLREQRPRDPNLLVIGSSVAWRHFDGRVAFTQKPQIRAINAGFCGLNARQSVDVADWLLPHLPHVTRVLLIAAPQDFTQCAEVPPAFDVEDAERYVFERMPEFGFYLRYFDPVSLVRNATEVAAKRSNRIPLDPLVFTPYGDGPLDTGASRELTYGAIGSLDPTCFTAVHQFAARMSETHREFTVVTTPLHPDWLARFDPRGKLSAEYIESLGRALSGTGAGSWNANHRAEFGPAAFTDAIHLRWSAAHTFTEHLMGELAGRGRRL